jgi:hypothetical protein
MDTLEPADSAQDPLALLIGQMMCTAEMLISIHAHMERSEALGHSAPGAPPVPEVLLSLLCMVLGPLAAEDRRADIEATRLVLAEVADIVAEEIYFVTPPRPPARERGHRAQRTGRPRRPAA